MNTGYLDFCKAYNQKIKNDKDIKENSQHPLYDSRDRISFRINVIEICPAMRPIFGYNGSSLFTLDQEDLEYLFNKYSKKAQEELDKNIEEIKNRYNQI